MKTPRRNELPIQWVRCKAQGTLETSRDLGLEGNGGGRRTHHEQKAVTGQLGLALLKEGLRICRGRTPDQTSSSLALVSCNNTKAILFTAEIDRFF